MTETHYCSGEVYEARSMSFYSCSRKAKFERNGKWYCGTHDPVTKKEKQEAKLNAFKAKIKEDQKRRAIEECAHEMLELLIDARDNGVNEAWIKRRDAVIKKAMGEK